MSNQYQPRYQANNNNVDRAIIEETNSTVKTMVNDFKEINEILKTQQQYAQEQQVGLDTSEANVQNANDALDTAVDELGEARSLRRACCGCCGIPPCCKPCLGDSCCQYCTIM